MELYQLKTFLAVAREEHLTRAAERLHISQPSVSAHIKALEEELGVTLFIRTARGMVLNHAGRAIKAKAELALKAVEAVQLQADRLRSDLSGPARIGLNIDAQFLRVPELLLVLQRDYPRLQLHLHQRHSIEAHDDILNGRLDAAFVFELPDNPGLTAKRLATLGIAMVAPPNWQKRLQDWNMKSLAEFPWIWTDHRCPFNRIIRQLFEPMDRMPEKLVVVDQDTTIRKMVASGAGLGLMAAPEALEAARQNQVLILGDPVCKLDLSLLYHCKRRQEPLIQAMIRAADDVWRPPSGNGHPACQAVQHWPVRETNPAGAAE